MVAKNPLRDLIVAGLWLDLPLMLSERTGVSSDKLRKNYMRRVRRGNPGLSKKYVEEEALRRIAKELYHYTAVPAEIQIGQIELSLKQALLSQHGLGILANLGEYYFPMTSFSAFSSHKYEPKDSD